MTTLTEIRNQYPQYADMPDDVLANALYKKFYSDIPRAEFDSKVGLKPAQAPAQANGRRALGRRRLRRGPDREGLWPR